VPTLIITEVVLIYIENKSSQELLNWMTSFFENVSIVNYEMINPHDSFGKMMVSNIQVRIKILNWFEERGCKLLGIKDCDSLIRQKERLSDAGFKRIEAYTILEVYNKYVDLLERQRIAKLEIFDEFEEWELIQSHYCFVLASNFDADGPFVHFYKAIVMNSEIA
jgi:tRNA wybutosine-synthesizing protein 4